MWLQWQEREMILAAEFQIEIRCATRRRPERKQAWTGFLAKETERKGHKLAVAKEEASNRLWQEAMGNEGE